jgi:hypothetical protein
MTSDYVSSKAVYAAEGEFRRSGEASGDLSMSALDWLEVENLSLQAAKAADIQGPVRVEELGP